MLTLQTEIYSIITDEEDLEVEIANHMTNYEGSRNRTQKDIFALKQQLGEDKAATTTPHSTERALVGLKLKDVCLPRFSGKSSENFLDFINIFERTMISNNYDSISQFLHLKSLLDGTALAAVSNLQLTTENDKIALQKLRRRFGLAGIFFYKFN